MNDDSKNTTIQCLVFDDDVDDAERFSEALMRGWREARMGVPHLPDLNVQLLTDDRLAGERLTHGNRLDIFVCDIFVRDKMIGFELIAKAKAAAGVPLVIAISKGPNDRDADLFERLRDGTGCHDEYVSKKWFQAESNRFTERWISRLESLGRLRFRGEVVAEPEFEGDPALESIWEEITPQTISAIGAYFCVDQTTDKMYVAPVDAGKSGASVLKLRFGSNSPFDTTKGVLLKVSRDADSLNSEYERYKQEFGPGCRLDTSLVVQLLGKRQPFTANGWIALGGNFVTNGKPLVSWLVDDCPNTNAAIDILESLFTKDALSACYKAHHQNIKTNIFSSLAASTLTPLRRSRVQKALRELLPLAEKYSPTTSSLPMLRGFLKDSTRLGAVASHEISPNTVVTVQHGDLHGRNVLIQSNGANIRPKVIDYATAATLPWQTDTVRLTVDLLLSCLCPGAAGYEWELFEQWLKLSSLLICGEVPDSAQCPSFVSQEPLMEVIAWMYRNRFEIAGVKDDATFDAEYLIAMAIELMRASYRDTVITAPKRTLALALSETCFLRAEAAFSGLRAPRSGRPVTR